jgi:hypothetical protein
MGANRRRQLSVVGSLAIVDAIGLLVFGLIGWL